MTAPVYIVAIAVLASLILGICLGLWMARASLEWLAAQEQQARDWHARHVGSGMPTEEDEALTDDELRKRGFL